MAKKHWFSVHYLIFFIVAALYLLIVSFTTSPLFGEPFAGDSAMFQTIGKYWAEGTIPYSGLWDSKGPIIFFINALGYWFLESKTGIFAIQIVCLFTVQILLHKIFAKAFSFKSSILLTLLMICIMPLVHDSNSTEEYLLPFLTACFYFIFSWTLDCEENCFEHNPRYAFLYGITFSFCLLTRLTNAVALCAAILIISCTLIVKKEWASLLKNIIMFILGFLLLTVPFIVYFAVKGLLYEAVYGTFIYNLDYARNSSLAFSLQNPFSSIKLLIAYSPSIILIVLGLVKLFRQKKYAPGILWIAVGAVTIAWLFRSNGYLHYGLIAFPYIAIVLVEVKKIFSNTTKNCINHPAIVLSGIYILLLLLGSGLRVKDIALQYYNAIFIRETETYNTLQKSMLTHIPENERNSFIAYNANPGLYLQFDLKPYYRFFTMQDWAASRSATLTDKLIETFESGDVKWIFVEGDPSQTLICDILSERYICVEQQPKPYTNSTYSLFKLKG